jgi:hypothetical protein
MSNSAVERRPTREPTPHDAGQLEGLRSIAGTVPARHRARSRDPSDVTRILNDIVERLNLRFEKRQAKEIRERPKK